MQNLTTVLKKLNYFWKKSQVPIKQPIQISTIDKLIIFEYDNLDDILNGSFPPPNNDPIEEENQDTNIMRFGGKTKRRR